MKKYFLLLPILLLLFLIPFYGKGSNGTITGKIDFCKGQKISLIVYENLLTYSEKEIAESQIDSLGNFSIHYHISTTQYAILKINYIKKYFTIEPGKQYSIHIFSDTKLNAEQINSPTISEFINLKIFNDTLNQNIDKLNETYNQFVVANSIVLINKGGKKQIEDLEKTFQTQFGNYTNIYFQQCLQYKIASLKLMAGFYTDTQFAKIYFLNKPVLYRNIEYMDVFNQYFNKYLSNFNLKNEDGLSFKEILNQDADYNKTIHLLYEDENLHSDTLAELVLLKGLFELYHNKDYNQSNILKLVHYMEGCAMYKANRDVAESMGNIFLSSAQAADFTLHDIKGNLISLSNFKNKYVYLNFWKSEIPECSNDFDIMNEDYDKCKEKVEFISICTDSKIEKMKAYLEQHSQYQWHFLYYENNFNLLESFHVVSFPSYILIDPKGYIVDYSAARPTENLASLLTIIMTSK